MPLLPPQMPKPFCMSGERLPTCSFFARTRIDLGICYSNGKFSAMGLAPETRTAMLDDLGLITTDDYEEDALIPLNIPLLWEGTFFVSRRIRLCCCIKDMAALRAFRARGGQSVMSVI
jgi:hypothetical protein